MNKRLLISSLAAIVCFISLTSGIPGRNKSFAMESIAAAESESGEGVNDIDAVNVIVPTYIYDFTDDDTFSISYSGNCVTVQEDDGLLCTASDNDPNIGLSAPLEQGSRMGWMVIKYCGNVYSQDQRYGELYFTTETRSLGENSKVFWQWNGITDEWSIAVVKARIIGRQNEEILDIRYDPLASGPGSVYVQEGEELKTAYIAFFETEEDANNFDYDAYIEKLKRDNEKHESEAEKWNKPPKSSDGVTLIGDNSEGTLKIEHRDGDRLGILYSFGKKNYAYDLPDDLFFLNGALSGTDDLGRTQPDQFTVIDPDYVGRDAEGNAILVDSDSKAVGVFGENGRRYTGIFYFIWLGTQSDTARAPRNISELLEQYGEDAKKEDKNIWGEVYSTFFFAEPLYGYYRSDDEWVIRKHMELLTNAGIDFLYFDVTNNYLYESNVIRILKILHELNEQDFPAPKIVFYTNTNAAERVRQAYLNIYEPGLYPDTWFMLDGKPLIIAPESANIDGFFTIREPQWPNEEHHTNTWPWIDWQWPQETYGKDDAEAINVSVAQHSGNSIFSSSGLYGYKGNRGRSYDGYNDDHTDDSYKNGTNIQLQFNRAITSGVPYVLITGWNEWIASRQESRDEKNPVCFIDTFNFEYSRDIEMSRGGYFDNYYMQLAANTAAIRGAAPVILRDDRHQIDVTGSFGQWDEIDHYYSDPSGDTEPRDARGYGTLKYTNETGRNDIVRVKVTGDASYLYFYVECAANIVHGTGSDSWMQILLDTDPDNAGWYGYDYIVNYMTKNDYTSSLAKYTGTGGEYAFTGSADLTYQVSGNKMMVAVPLEAIGVEYYNRIDLAFKIVDSKSAVNTMEQMYEDGDAAPLGRLNYTYKTFIASEETPGEAKAYRTVAVADRAERAEQEKKGITDDGETIGADEKKQDKGVLLKVLIPVLAVLILSAVAIAAVVIIKKKKASR